MTKEDTAFAERASGFPGRLCVSRLQHAVQDAATGTSIFRADRLSTSVVVSLRNHFAQIPTRGSS